MIRIAYTGDYFASTRVEMITLGIPSSSSPSLVSFRPSPDISLSNLPPFTSVGSLTHSLGTHQCLEVIFPPCSRQFWILFSCSAPSFSCFPDLSTIICPYEMPSPFAFQHCHPFCDVRHFCLSSDPFVCLSIMQSYFQHVPIFLSAIQQLTAGQHLTEGEYLGWEIFKRSFDKSTAKLFRIAINKVKITMLIANIRNRQAWRRRRGNLELKKTLSSQLPLCCLSKLNSSGV